MNTYSLITVEEMYITEGGSISTTIYTIPVNNGIPVTDYVTKFRILQNNQMLVFDTEQEYKDYLNGNNYLRP
jgi:hypothetical protein